MPDPGLSSPLQAPPAPAAAPSSPSGPPSDPFASALTAALAAATAAAGSAAGSAGSTGSAAPAESAEASSAPVEIVEAAPVAVSGSGLQRILRGPSGLGTKGLFLVTEPPQPAAVEQAVQGLVERLAEPVAEAAAPVVDVPVEGVPVPGLYFHPIPEPDPARVAEVSRRIKEWAVDEVDLFPDEWEGQFDGFSVGRYMVACHPDAPTVDHVMLATRLMVAENAVDDCYCEDHGGSPVGLGGRLLLAHTALDPLHTTAEYAPGWAESLGADAPRRAYRSAMRYFTEAASASQADRFRHDMARLHLGYLAEAAWSETDHVPEVWEYLAMRQFNNFRPCPTITDSVGGYELPADLHAMPETQRVIALAGNATTIVNDLYSYTKELASPGRHLNLPVVISEREGRSDRDGYLKAVEVHNELMHAFETEAAALAASCPAPPLLRFLRGVAAWVDGNHHWHQTNTYRYSLPDFW
ncbi:2-methylisoborneol synthase [Kitasatospora sp. NA04385]|uniref:family 2 encapsulin nanocompartment cargo protein terpene cyclase n=1 Tax=Kitasatospora sp. NA04385 TaxID=2742135 RepID=UPI001590B667|nr:family 2 encapsulin nanocompartment cargo protein terpene cyclase [Kitasatospora sp. NA04385]QKW23354.1 2-methylisoborneol synthase [Kitasatospora sp. NA04385]